MLSKILIRMQKSATVNHINSGNSKKLEPSEMARGPLCASNLRMVKPDRLRSQRTFQQKNRNQYVKTKTNSGGI